MRRSCHSPMTRMLHEAHAACTEAAARGLPIDEVTQRRAERALTRREFLRHTGTLVTAGAASLVHPARAAAAATQPRIVIVGAGLAGIRCAHKLWTERSIRSTIYEANEDRAGGRVETLRGFFANGQIAEKHGEFISSEHSSMLSLVNRYGLALDQANTEPAQTQDVYWFNGGYYTQAQLNADWQTFGWSLFKQAVKQAPWPTRYNSYTKQAYQWDQISVVEWINTYIPGGMASPFGRLCYEDAISEYGGPPEQQSALNLVYILGYDDSTDSGSQPKNAPVLAGTDEMYHVRGGNDQIIQNMVAELPSGTIQYGQRLEALTIRSDGSYLCTFASGLMTPADHVVLAIPFTTLRQVTLTNFSFSARKVQAIMKLPLGTNAKVMLQFTKRVWYKSGYTATTYSDLGSPVLFDVPDGPPIGATIARECTNYQPGATGVLINYPGGAQLSQQLLSDRYGLSLGQDDGRAPTQMVQDALQALGQIFPGVGGAFNNLAYYSAGILDPNLLGAWSQYNIGQYTGFSGIEPVREGNIHFAGEQTSLDFQGYMEGGVTSGERVAGEI